MLASVLTALRSRATRVSMKGLSYIKSKRDNNDTCDYGEDCEDDEDDDDGGNYEEDDSSEEHEEDMEEDEQTDTYDVDNDAFAVEVKLSAEANQCAVCVIEDTAEQQDDHGSRNRKQKLQQSEFCQLETYGPEKTYTRPLDSELHMPVP
ncbi:hypothetical protein BGZ54_002794 [Gamsiella multidivaricata]|nr:hypothetical protein BGZ54_002794 [Gamsiella multidivaricata]